MLRVSFLLMSFLVVALSSGSRIRAGGIPYVSDLSGNEQVIEPSQVPSPTILDQSNLTRGVGKKEVVYIQSAADDNRLFEIFMTSALTISGGVIVYVLGQIISKFFIEPIHGQREIIGKIADALIYYANIYSNPNIMSSRSGEASDKLRELATLLQSKTQFIPLYGFFEKMKWVVDRSNIYDASRNLIGLSNSAGRVLGDAGVKNLDRADSIRSALNIYSPEN